MTTIPPLAHLLAIAQAATPGPWRESGTDVLIGDDWGNLNTEADALHIATFSPSCVVALIKRVQELEAGLGDAWELTNKADAALCEIISEGQRTLEIPSSPAWRGTPIGKARLLIVEADDTLRTALHALVKPTP